MTITAATKRKVARNPCASTAAVVTTISALISYGGSVVDVNLPSWVTALLTGALITGSLSFARMGLVGLWRAILYGSNDPG